MAVDGVESAGVEGKSGDGGGGASLGRVERVGV